MESASPGKDRLCSNEWVDIVVTKNGNEGQVKVDGIVVSMQSSEFALTHITAAHPLYIGGVAGESTIFTIRFISCYQFWCSFN